MKDYRTGFSNPWPTLAERDWLRQQAAEIAARFEQPVIVHIGVAEGISLYASHAGAPGARLVGVDLDFSQWVQGIDAELIEGDSYLIGVAFDGPVHFLFVDGGHHQATVSGDILAWEGHIPPGGVIALHDYGNAGMAHCRGVKAAVDAWDWSGWEEIPAAKSIRAFRRLKAGEE